MRDMHARHQVVFQQPDCQALLRDDGVPIPDADALRRVGSVHREDFLKVGYLIHDNLRRLCGLQPHHAVLDVGCGWGRLAIPLTRFLAVDGRYVGLDVAERAIAWCRQHIGRDNSPFTFHFIDVANSYANPSGTASARSARFADYGAFDIAVASSLFTHMLPADMDHYLGELAGVLVPGGTLYATFFILDDQVEQLCRTGCSNHAFNHAIGVARISNPSVPEDAVAYPLDHVAERLSAHGFAPRIYRGAWSGRPGGCDYQDVIVATRVA